MPSVPDPYNFDSERGWRSYRLLRPGRGMYHDIKRRLPYYGSDITDALTYRTFASTVRIYFVKLVLTSSPVFRCHSSTAIRCAVDFDIHAVFCLLLPSYLT